MHHARRLGETEITNVLEGAVRPAVEKEALLHRSDQLALSTALQDDRVVGAVVGLLQRIKERETLFETVDLDLAVRTGQKDAPVF